MRLIFFLLLIFGFSVQAQINLQRPLERCVYQRNNQNIGWVEVKGTLTESFSKMEAKLLPFLPNQGTESDWQTIYITGNQIGGHVKGFGGFYNLVLRGTTTNGRQIIKEVNKVGIGEVFITAGQSNTLTAGPYPTDERVIGVNLLLDAPGYPTFVNLNRNIQWPIYPNSGGGLAFCGKLGDIILQKHHVPVLFMQAGSGGSRIESWGASSQNGQAPYLHLKNAITRFSKEYGLRAVLWHQGETNSIESKTPSELYKNQLTTVIEQSRKDLGYNLLPWAVARVSWIKGEYGSSNTDEFRKEVINGQNAVIATVPNVFVGPETDKIEGYPNSEMRGDGVHFTMLGQTKHAELWDEKLDDTFWKSSFPFQPYNGILKSQTITFPSISSVSLDTPSFEPTVSSNSELGVIMKVVSGPAMIEFNKVILTKTAVGTVVVEATQEGNHIYSPAVPIRQSFEVLKGNQTITFSSISSVPFEAPSFTPVASSSTGLGVVFKIISGPATIESNKIILTKNAVGTVVVEASQSGNDIYNSAVPVRQSFEVLKGSQTITFPSMSSVTLDAPSFTPVATSSRGLGVVFKVISGPATIEYSKIILTKTAIGTVIVEATQTGNDIYNPAIPVRQSFEILRGNQNINFPIIYSKIFDKEVIDLKATSTSNLPVVYKIVSGNAKLTQNLLTIDKPSKITIEASQSGNDIYKPATNVQSSFDVFQIPQKIQFPVITEKAHNTPIFELMASIDSNLGLSFKIVSGPATIEGKTIKLTGQTGTVVVEISQAGDDFYEAAVQRQEFNVYLLLGTENLPNIAVYPNPAKTYLNVESAELIVAAYLVNTSGVSQKIDLQKMSSTKYSVDISSIQSDFYVLRLQDKKNNYYHKSIIVE